MVIALKVISKKNIRRLIFLLYIIIFHLAIYYGLKYLISYFPNYQWEITNNIKTIIAFLLPVNISVFLLFMLVTWLFVGLNFFRIVVVFIFSLLAPFYILGFLSFVDYIGEGYYQGFIGILLLLAILYALVPYSKKDFSNGLKFIIKFIHQLKTRAQK